MFGQFFKIKKNIQVKDKDGKDAAAATLSAPRYVSFAAFDILTQYNSIDITVYKLYGSSQIKFGQPGRIVSSHSSQIKELTEIDKTLTNASMPLSMTVHANPEQEFHIGDLIQSQLQTYSSFATLEPSKFEDESVSMDEKIRDYISHRNPGVQQDNNGNRYMHTNEIPLFLNGSLHGIPSEISQHTILKSSDFGINVYDFTVEVFDSANDFFASLHNGFIDYRADDRYCFDFVEFGNDVKIRHVYDSDPSEGSASYDPETGIITAPSQSYLNQLKEHHFDPLTPYERFGIECDVSVTSYSEDKIFKTSGKIYLSLSLVGAKT